MPANNNLPVQTFTKQYAKVLSTVYDAKSYFTGAFAPIQSLDGITHNSKAFSVKTSGTPIVLGTYNKGENVAFGTGTGNSSRFGPRTEIIYADNEVGYAYEITAHEGIDRVTVNNDFNTAVVDRLKLRSEAQVRYMNQNNGKYMSESAGDSKNLKDYSDVAVKALFNKVNKHYVNKEVSAPVTAYITPDLYSAIIDNAATTTAKGSAVSIDDNGLAKFKGFKLVEVPEQYFVDGEIAYFSPDSVFIPFVGIATARTIEVEGFDGVALQLYGKGGQYILDDNKPAVVKVTLDDPIIGG